MFPVQDILTLVSYLRKDPAVSVKDALKSLRNVLNYGFDLFVSRSEPLPMHAGPLSSDEDAAANLEAACTMHAAGDTATTGGGAIIVALLPFLLDLARRLIFK